MRKKSLAIMLVSAMLIGLLSACGGSGNGANVAATPDSAKSTAPAATQSTASVKEESKETETPAPAADSSAEWTWPLDTKKELSFWISWQSDYLNSPDELKSIQQIEKNTNVHINWQTANSTEAAEKFGLMLASGKYPDIIRGVNTLYPGGVERGVQDGVFLELTDHIAEYMPNYMNKVASVEGLDKQVITDDHRYVGVWTLASNFGDVSGERVWGGPMYRKDWLEELGMEVPETIADWDAYFRAVKENHSECDAPFMTGKNGYNAYGAWISAYGVGPEFFREGNTVKYGPLEQGYKDYVAQMHQWYVDGILDPNFITNDSNIVAVLDYLGTGRSAASTSIAGHTGNRLKAMGYNDEEDFFIAASPYPVMNDGDTPQCILDTSSLVKECMAIAAKTADPELTMRYLDYWYTDECMVLDSMGIEDETYFIEDGVYHLAQPLRDKFASGEYATLSQVMYTYTLGTAAFGLYNWACYIVMNEDDPGSMEANVIWNTAQHDLMVPSSITMTDEENKEYTSLYTDLQTLANENTVKFITGEKSMDEWDSFVDQLKQFGAERCVELKQAALDRYNAR